VAIVGGSLAGLSLASRLARAGVAVGLWEERARLGGFAWRAPGLLLSPLGEHPSRLAASLGEPVARAMLRFVQKNHGLLAERGSFEACGSIHLAAMDGEDGDVERCLELLPRLGVPVEAVQPRWGSQGFGPGYALPGDGRVDGPALVQALAAEARQAGGLLRAGSPVLELGHDQEGPWLQDEQGRVRVETVVFAGGAEQARLERFFADSLHPVRHQWLLTEETAVELPRAPILGQHQHSLWSEERGRVLAGGARYVSLEMESGQTDDARIEPRIDHVLRANLGRFFPRFAELSIDYAWTAIAAHSCDGLPLIGPLPGRARLLALTGMHGQEYSLAFAAAEAIAAGLLGVPGPELPRLFQPTRLV